MADINEVPVGELVADAEESLHDIDLCRLTLVMGMSAYNDRMIGNIEIVRSIVRELARRLGPSGTPKGQRDEPKQPEGEQNDRQE